MKILQQFTSGHRILCTDSDKRYTWFNHALSSYPLLIQFHQLLCDFGCVECQSEAGQIQLGEKVLQYLFDGQSSGSAVLRGGRHCVLKDRTS